MVRRAFGGRPAVWIGVLAWVLYGVSFFLPAFTDGAERIKGYSAFLLNLLFTFSDLVDFVMVAGVLANTLLWAAGFFFVRRAYLASWVIGGISTMLACVYMPYVLGLLVGYYLWVLSMALFTAAGVIAWIRARRGELRGFEVVMR